MESVTEKPFLENLERKNRVLELAWWSYHEQVKSCRRFTDKSLLIVAGTTAAISLIIRINDASPFANRWAGGCSIASMVFLVFAIVSCFMLWKPRHWHMPGSHDVNELWQQYIVPNDDTSFANFVRDLCLATNNMEPMTLILSRYFSYCMISCGASISLALAAELLGEI